MRKVANLISTIICVTGLVILSAVAAQSQGLNPSTTGALLTINGTVFSGSNGTTVNVSIGDKDIVAATNQPTVGPGGASTCTAADQVSTQGYVLQAAAPTGCDPGDFFEGTILDGHATLSGDGYSFGITTHYQCGPNDGTCNVGITMTNKNGNITSGDTGFLTVSNNGPVNSYFVGTITLEGTPGPAAAGTGCSPGQSLKDSVTFTTDSPFNAPSGEIQGQSVILALALDSSGCGGFNSSQTGQTMNPGSVQNLNQSFPFANGTATFNFDFTTSFDTNDDLTVVSNTVPTITLQGITQATYAAMVAGTSQATTQCLTVPGLGTDSQGNPLCAQFTILCTNNNSPTPAGDNCPQSTERNLLLKNELSTSGDVSIPMGTAPTMANGSDTWSPPGTGSPAGCAFVPGSPEGNDLCPKSSLTQAEVTSADCSCVGGGTGKTLNSSFIYGTGQPEWNTVPTVPAWSNSTTVPVSFTSNAPTPPSGSNNNWVASPNKSIIWGLDPGGVNTAPDPTFPIPGDETDVNPNPTGSITGSSTCPSTWPAPGTKPPNFVDAGKSVTVGGAGTYEIHFASEGCDDQLELAYPSSMGSASPLNQNLATFKTVSFGVDQTPPTITTPVLNGGIGNNTFAPGSNLNASFSCTDDLSGLAGCGKNALPLPANYAPFQTGQPPIATRLGPAADPLSENVTNYSITVTGSGPQTLTVYATDLAGNQSNASAQYCPGYNVVSVDTAGLVGFTSPVVNPGPVMPFNINAASANQAIPMKLTVSDCFGNPVTNLNLSSSGGTVVLTAANASICKVETPDNSISTAAAGSSGWQNLGGGSYQYNWKPLPPKGSCLSFSVNLGDGIVHTAYFQFH